MDSVQPVRSTIYCSTCELAIVLTGNQGNGWHCHHGNHCIQQHDHILVTRENTLNTEQPYNR